MFTKQDFEAGRIDPAAESAAPAAPAADQPAHPCRVAFCSTMCLLDPVSGAAISARNILAALAGAGFEVRVFTASLFDANAEVPFAPILGSQAEPAEARGKILRLEREGIEHQIFLTQSSRGPNMTRAEQARVAAKWRERLAGFRPDIVMTYGNSALARQMQADARETGAQVVFYLGNAEVESPDLVQPGDRVVCSSGFLAEHYRQSLGADPHVLNSIVNPERIVPPGAPSIASQPHLRQLGLVTFINPLPHKGLTLFARLAQRALRERPQMRFAVIEGRMTRELLQRLKLDLPAWRNVWWLPAQADMAAVYARSSVLLVPSFWREGFGRSAAEAQLSGLPVLASDRGGLAETLNGGGAVLPVPQACADNHYAFPDAETVEAWWQALVLLWDDEAAYAAASARAREAGQRYAPERTMAAAVAHFSAIAAARAAAGPPAPDPAD